MNTVNGYPTHFEHRSRLAQWAYRLACAGPISFLVVAEFYPHHYRHETPALLAQIVWWMFCLASPVGAVLGLIALIQMQNGNSHLTGENYGVASIVVGLIASFAIFCGTPSLNVPLGPQRPAIVSCESNLKQMGLAMTQYVQDWDEDYPLPQTWNEAIKPYTKSTDIFKCPSEPIQDVPSYGMNGNLKGVTLAEVEAPAETIQLFESVPGKNRIGGIEQIAQPARHSEQDNINFLDGHVKSYNEKNIKRLRWTIAAQKTPAKKKSGQ